jgi:MFS superfamily sulfate permease-like transporter
MTPIAIIILVIALFLSEHLRSLPQPVLAAVVLFAVAGLFQVSALRRLWHASRSELIVALAALAGVLGSGLLRGVMIGAVISIVQLLRRASKPHVALLGRIPGTRRYSDSERHPDNELDPGILIFRPESGLVYFNIDHVRDTIAARVAAEASPPALVIIDLSAVPIVDLQAVHALADLAAELIASGIRVQAVEARASVRERLRREGLEPRLGEIDRFTSVADVVDDLQRQGSMVKDLSPTCPELEGSKPGLDDPHSITGIPPNL